MILTDKEKSLLKELAVQEKTCAKKYLNASRAAFDPQLKNLFSSLSQAEQKHLEMINSILSGSPCRKYRQEAEKRPLRLFIPAAKHNRSWRMRFCVLICWPRKNTHQESMIQGCLNSEMPVCAIYLAQYKGRSRDTGNQYRII